MITLIQLCTAHFIGDFLLQPNSWVKDKVKNKAKSPRLYLHILLHGMLVWVFVGKWQVALTLLLVHGLIDVLKLYAPKNQKSSLWFLLDQALHVVSIFGIWMFFYKPELDFSAWTESKTLWAYAAALVFLTAVSGILMRELMSRWSRTLNEGNKASLDNAGKYIGMLERLFVFLFVVTDNWEGIGFLLAAKSVFRFGDLKESKDRKLTEYILIGTLLSVGIAIATGLLVLYLSSIN